MTQDELGKKVGIPRPRISEIEAGRFPSDPEKVWRLADALSCTCDELLRPFALNEGTDDVKTEAVPHDTMIDNLIQQTREKLAELDKFLVGRLRKNQQEKGRLRCGALCLVLGELMTIEAYQSGTFGTGATFGVSAFPVILASYSIWSLARLRAQRKNIQE